jgi:type VI secretion system protein ImpA
MASLQALDIEALFVPIPGEQPAGQDLLYEGTYEAIRKARQEGRDRDALEPGVKSADWAAVIAIATDALTDKSKDLQIAVWLVDALVKRHGFPGLRDGLQYLRELQQRFWASLYPVIANGDLEDRTRLLEWLNRELPLSIRQIPLTQSRDGAPYAWVRWEESRTVDNLGRQNQEALEAALADGKITGEQFGTAVAATPRVYYETLWVDLRESQEAYEALDRVLDEKFGRQAPSLLGIKKALEDCSGLVERIIKRKRESEPDSAAREREPRAESGGTATASLQSGRGLDSAAVASNGVPLAPQSRADALCRLATVAHYFRQTEPHSPVAYLIERAMRWGEMPLEKWLQEVISNEEVLVQLRDTLGLRAADTSNDN